MLAVFDGHNDALTRADADDLATGRASGHLDLPRMAAGGLRGGIFAIFTPGPDGGPGAGAAALTERPPAISHEHAAAHAAAVAGRLFALERAGHVRVTRTIGDVDAARDGHAAPAAVLHLEGAEAIDRHGEALELWHAAGLRSLGLVWSRPNVFGEGVPFTFGCSPDTGPGLTEAGRSLVTRCAQLGVLVDLSHLNERGFWDVARLEAGPLVASHSAAHALCAASRNLTDAQLDAVAASGGLVGIVFACPFLRPDFADDPDTPVALIADHARHVAERIGAAHVALGSDFDGATIPAGVRDASGMPRVLHALRDVGFSESEVAAIAWENWRRTLDAWWR